MKRLTSLVVVTEVSLNKQTKNPQVYSTRDNKVDKTPVRHFSPAVRMLASHILLGYDSWLLLLTVQRPLEAVVRTEGIGFLTYVGDVHYVSRSGSGLGPTMLIVYCWTSGEETGRWKIFLFFPVCHSLFQMN